MPNYCSYQMKIRGTEESCNEWLSRMSSYDHRFHFYRIFEAYVSDSGGTPDDYYMIIDGDCAWSLESCCRASGYSGGTDLFAVNSKGLNICMEAYSEEPGCQFQEHYMYKNGICVADECEEWIEYWWDKGEYPEFKDFIDATGLTDLTEDDLDENDYYHTGGFPDWVFSI